MCGNYDSVIGMRKDTAVEKFARPHTKARFTSATGEATLCGLFVETDDRTGLATSIKFIRLGGCLAQSSF
jgi:calcineurin-like phosphoesterase